MDDFIRIRGAREHNLRSIDLDLPRNRLVVITGLSGSGKSSLAFDTIYADGQRRYVESLSAYARQFLELMQKPDVDSITGLSPAIAIEQHLARSIVISLRHVPTRRYAGGNAGLQQVKIRPIPPGSRIPATSPPNWQALRDPKT